MAITRVQRRFITYEVIFEQKEDSNVTYPEVEEWQVVDAGPSPPFGLFDVVSQEEIDADCEPDV